MGESLAIACVVAITFAWWWRRVEATVLGVLRARWPEKPASPPASDADIPPFVRVLFAQESEPFAREDLENRALELYSKSRDWDQVAYTLRLELESR